MKDLIVISGPMRSGKTFLVNVITSIVRKSGGKVIVETYSDVFNDKPYGLQGVSLLVIEECSAADIEKMEHLKIQNCTVVCTTLEFVPDNGSKPYTVISFYDRFIHGIYGIGAEMRALNEQNSQS